MSTNFALPWVPGAKGGPELGQGLCAPPALAWAPSSLLCPENQLGVLPGSGTPDVDGALGMGNFNSIGVVARPFQGPGGQMPPGGATGEEHPLGELCKEGFVALGSKNRNSALVVEIAAVLQFRPVLPRIWCVMREGAEGWGVVGYLASSQKPT